MYMMPGEETKGERPAENTWNLQSDRKVFATPEVKPQQGEKEIGGMVPILRTVQFFNMLKTAFG